MAFPPCKNVLTAETTAAKIFFKGAMALYFTGVSNGTEKEEKDNFRHIHTYLYANVCVHIVNHILKYIQEKKTEMICSWS